MTTTMTTRCWRRRYGQQMMAMMATITNMAMSDDYDYVDSAIDDGATGYDNDDDGDG